MRTQAEINALARHWLRDRDVARRVLATEDRATRQAVRDIIDLHEEFARRDGNWVMVINELERIGWQN